MVAIKENIMKAADLISGGFVWKNTKQGHAYWRGVVNSLEDLAEKGEVEYDEKGGVTD